MTKEQLDETVLCLLSSVGACSFSNLTHQVQQRIFVLAREGLQLREHGACKHGVVCSPDEHCSLCEDDKRNETISALTAELDSLRKNQDEKLLWLWRHKENRVVIQLLRNRDDDTSLSTAIDSAPGACLGQQELKKDTVRMIDERTLQLQRDNEALRKEKGEYLDHLRECSGFPSHLSIVAFKQLESVGADKGPHGNTLAGMIQNVCEQLAATEAKCERLKDFVICTSKGREQEFSDLMNEPPSTSLTNYIREQVKKEIREQTNG